MARRDMARRDMARMHATTSRRQFLTGACAWPAMLASSRVSAQQLQPTTIADASGTGNLTVHQMLADLGMFEKYGLKANLLNVADGSKIIGGLIGGDIDSSMMSGFGQVFPAIEKGAKLKIIAGTQLRPALTLFTAKENIRSLKDLEGKTIGAGAIGSLLHQMCVAILLKNKIEVGKVRFVNIGSSADVFRATRVGTIDAGLGDTALIDELGSYPGLREVPGGNLSVNLTEYTYQGAWTSDRMIQTKRDMLVRSLAAQVDLYRFLQSPESKESFFAARAKVLPGSNQKEAASQWDYIQHYKPYAVDLTLDEERIMYMQNVNIEMKVQSSLLPIEKVADMSLAREALALFEKIRAR